MRILILLTASNFVTLKDGSLYPTGVWAEEFAVPYQHFISEGFTVHIASTGGRRPAVDPMSLSTSTMGLDLKRVTRYFTLMENTPEFNSPMDINTIDKDKIASYDALYFPGGPAVMEDIANSFKVGDILRWAKEMGKSISASSYGTAALFSSVATNGDWLFSGYKVTGISNNEESMLKLNEKLPYSIEDRFKELGGNYSKALIPFASHVVEDRELVTGDNPASAKDVAEKTVLKLKGVQAGAR
jgi:putative intracellular protease/amidase